MKKKILALCLVVVLAITAVTGATLAYFTDTDKAVNTFTTANVDIKLIEQERNEDGTALKDFDTQNAKVLYPITGSAQGEKDKWGQPVAGNYIDKIVTVQNLATDAYVRLYYAIPAVLTNSDPAQSVVHVNVGNRVDFGGNGAYNDGGKENWNPKYENVGTETLAGTFVENGITYNVYYFDYEEVLGKNDTTAAFLAGIYMDQKVNYDNVAKKYTLNNDVIEYDFSKGVKIPVCAVGVQAAGFDNCAEAVEAAFPDFKPFG